MSIHVDKVNYEINAVQDECMYNVFLESLAKQWDCCNCLFIRLQPLFLTRIVKAAISA